MVFSVLGNSAYSDHVSGSGGTIDVVAAEGSNTISISGTTDRSDEVIVKVLAPNRNIVSIDQITPTGEGMRLGYSTTITTGGPLWNQDGDYSITIQQSGGNCTLVGGTSSDDREHDRDAKWSCSAGTVQGFAQFMENKYNHVVRVAITSGATSETSVSIDYLIEHDEYYVSGQNIPTAKSLKKLTLTADGIQGSTTINVSGTTDKSNEVIIKVTAPNGNIISISRPACIDNEALLEAVNDGRITNAQMDMLDPKGRDELIATGKVDYHGHKAWEAYGVTQYNERYFIMVFQEIQWLLRNTPKYDPPIRNSRVVLERKSNALFGD